MSRNNEQRAATRSERAEAQRAQQVRDNVLVPYEQMNRAERRKYERALRRGKQPDAVRRTPGGSS